MKTYTDQTSNAFTKTFTIRPYQPGTLDNLTFAVKNLIDIAGIVSSCGNPSWTDTHPKAIANAVCVEQLLAAGATCLGTTVSDELAYSLIG